VADLLTSMQEHHAERLAIMQESDVPDPVGAAEDDRHRCEVESVMRRCYPDGERVNAYLAAVKKARGEQSARKLRNALGDAWRQRQKDLAGQA